MSTNLTVAIVGAGPAGLVSARWTLQYGLTPTLFESAATVGGVWRLQPDLSPRDTLAFKWPSDRARLSRYTCEFFGAPHDEHTDLFPTREQMGIYMHRYAQKFGILPHVRFGHRVVAVEPTEQELTNTRWRIRFRSASNEDHCEIFDCLIIATGYCAKPYIPKIYRDLLTDLNCPFGGRVFHSPTDAPLERSAYAGKDVVIVGNSFSALELLALVAGDEDPENSARRVSLIRRRPYWIIPKSLAWDKKHKPHNDSPATNSFPFDFLILRRCLRQKEAPIIFPEPESENVGKLHLLFESLLPEHHSMADGKFALNPAVHYQRAVCFSLVGESFTRNVERIGKRLQVFERDPLVAFEERALHLASGATVPCDLLVLGTGFECALHTILPSSVLEVLEYKGGKSHQPMSLYKCTLHPNLRTLAFVGVNESFLFLHMELQARWVAAVFSGRRPHPEVCDGSVSRYISELRASRDVPYDMRSPLPRGDFVGFADELAQEVGAIPDMLRMRHEDPELFAILWNAPVFGAHYFIEGPDADREAATAQIKGFRKDFPAFPINY